MGYTWEVELQRYRSLETGRFVKGSEVLEMTRDSIAATTHGTDKLAQLVADELISPEHWNVVMRQEIKREYIRQYLAGGGGRNAMLQSDWGSIGGMLNKQYNTYLGPFTEAIKKGELTEGQIRVRSGMYIDGAKSAYEVAHERAAEKAGNDEVIWILDPGAENCVDCEAFDAMGWQVIAVNPYGGAVPASGDTACLSNCKCHLEFRDSITGETWEG